MYRNIVLIISYCGTAYHGWQIQKYVNTVQGTLTDAISKLTKEAIYVSGCGRTDAGVHAKRYVANFKTSSSIPIHRLCTALNSLLPSDIAVLDAFEEDERFDSRFSCIMKEYSYYIYNDKIRNVFKEKSMYFYPYEIDIDKINKAVKYLEGTKDFSALRCVGTTTKTNIRTLYYCKAIKDMDNTIALKMCADGFLYNMVRVIAGTLLYVGCNKIKPQDICEILNSKDRANSGPTLPAHGLYMSGIWYKNFFISGENIDI